MLYYTDMDSIHVSLYALFSSSPLGDALMLTRVYWL